MNGRIRIAAVALAVVAAALPLCAVQSSSTPSPQSPPQASAPARPKMDPAESIDPHAAAAVRGPASPLTVQVKLRNKSMPGAHVVVKYTDGTLAGSCDTNTWGDCQVWVSVDNYRITATEKKLAGTVSVGVTDSTNQVVVQLSAAKAARPGPNP